MIWNTLVLLIVAAVGLSTGVAGQHSPNSLQAAIEALHRHHEILNSQQARHHEQGPVSVQQPHYPQTEDYFSDDNDYAYEAAQQQSQLNRALNLAREGERERTPSRYIDFDDEDGVNGVELEAKKRFIFRERDETPHKSVFRERGEYAAQSPAYLGQEFVEEMEREREEEEEERYRQDLRRLWNKFQQQENSIERQLFEEQQHDREEDSDEDEKRKRSFDLDEKKKRFAYLPAFIGPVPYKRRDYPLLPWLDVDRRRKRFPVAKRSAKPFPEEEASVSGTSDKVAKDLQGLFGAAEKKIKEATGESVPQSGIASVNIKIEKKSGHHHEEEEDEDEEHEEHDHEEDAHEHDHDRDHDHDHEDSSDEDEDESDKKKKRSLSGVQEKKMEVNRATKSSPEVVEADQIIPGDLSEFKKKKSLRWDQFFGYDKRKKKSVEWMGGKYQSMIRQPMPTAEEGEEKRKKKQMDPEQIDSMDEKLKNIEDLIIEETVKYTGAHEGVSNPGEIQKLKDHVISRLATAYSLEKMRRALDQLREDVDAERHLIHNEIEPHRGGDDEEGENDPDDEEEKKKKKKKRIAAKKDQMHGHVHPGNGESDTKKRKRNGSSFEEEEFSNALIGGPSDEFDRVPDFASESQCPLLHAMEKRCRGVDILSGDIHQQLMPVCAVHQLCYLCGTSQTSCDLQYLTDADAICGPNSPECESAARSALMILRGAPGPQLGPRECARNSCLYNAIRDIAN